MLVSIRLQIPCDSLNGLNGSKCILHFDPFDWHVVPIDMFNQALFGFRTGLFVCLFTRHHPTGASRSFVVRVAMLARAWSWERWLPRSVVRRDKLWSATKY